MTKGARIQAAFQQAIEGLPESLVFFPKGSHTVHASRDGKPVKADVSIDESILEPFQAALASRLDSKIRPFGAFDHQSGPASFIPKSFRWDDELGLMLDVEWTAAGRAAIEGRDYSYFSPVWIHGKDGKPQTLAANGEIGSLVNDPAFESMPRIAAANTETNNMNEILVQLGLLTEEEAAAENAMELAKAKLETLRNANKETEVEIEAAKVKADEAATACASAKAELETLKAAKDAAESALQATREASADAAIDGAIKAGRIAPKDEDSKAFWKASILKDDSAIKALNAIPANPVDGKTIVAGRTDGAADIPTVASKSEFDAMNPAAKTQFSKAGGKIQD